MKIDGTITLTGSSSRIRQLLKWLILRVCVYFCIFYRKMLRVICINLRYLEKKKKQMISEQKENLINLNITSSISY